MSPSQPPPADDEPGFEVPSARVPVRLVLADGTTYDGWHFGARVSACAELTLNTAHQGHPKTLSDPSVHGQIMVCTYPMIGNYGVPSADVDEHGLCRYLESPVARIAGLVVSEYCFDHMHEHAAQSLPAWLHQHGIPGIYGVDTRAIATRLRAGSQLAKIVFDGRDVPWRDPNARNLAAEMSCAAPYVVNPDAPSDALTVLVVDCGVKHGLLRQFVARGVRVKVVPWDFDFTGEAYDGTRREGGSLARGRKRETEERE